MPINRHRAAGLFIFLAVAIGTFLVLVKRSGEPTYNGRPLSGWLDEIDLSDSSRDKEAQEALRRMGTNALPRLVSMYRSKDSAPKRRLIQFVNQQRVVKLHLTTMYERQMRGVGGLVVVAPVAFPELVKMLNGIGQPNLAAAFIVQNGRDANYPLAVALADNDPTVRACAAYAVGMKGTNIQDILETLVARLADNSPRVRELSALSLGQIGSGRLEVVPSLINSLSDNQPFVRSAAAISLSNFHAQAKAAIPALLTVCADTDLNARTAATNAINAIR